ncbi:MAG: hypothetical protein R2880_18745 [Deinococcales bacterium]
MVLLNGESLILHIEFEAATKAEEMKWRMLDYMSRIVEGTHALKQCGFLPQQSRKR